MLYIQSILKYFPKTSNVFQSDTLFENTSYINYNDFMYMCSPNLYFIDNTNIVLLSDVFYTCNYFLKQNKKMYFVPPKIENLQNTDYENVDVFLLKNENLGITDEHVESLITVNNINKKYNSIYTNLISSYITLFNTYKNCCNFLYIKRHKAFDKLYTEFVEYATLFNIVYENVNGYIKIHSTDNNLLTSLNLFDYNKYIMSILTNNYTIYDTLTDFYNEEVLIK